MVSGGKTTLCDYSVLFSLVIYQCETARSEFEKESSIRMADWDERGMRETKKRFDYHFRKWLSNFCPLSPLFPLPPFCPPLSPTTPITPYNPPNIFRAPPFPPRVFSASAGVICASARVDGAGCATIVQKWINNSYAKLQTGSFPLQSSISKSYTVSQQSEPQTRTDVRFGVVDGLRLFQTWRIDFILQLVGYVKMLHLLFLAKYYGIGEIS